LDILAGVVVLIVEDARPQTGEFALMRNSKDIAFLSKEDD
jgi:hypothetical protein